MPRPDVILRPEAILRNVFGLPGYRGEQEQIISHVIGGADAIVLMPTGGGKSLCYQLPALCRAGVGIVVSPLIALMRNQVAAMRQLGINAAAMNSAVPPAEQARIRADLRSGKLDLLYVAPERLMMPDFLELLREAEIALFAIDEAHCVSQWGHDFRPEYLQLAALGELFPGVPRIALTATADMQSREEIRRRLGLDDARLFLASFDRPNIRYAVVPKAAPLKQLLVFLKAHEGESGIVYCLSRATVEATATALVAAGINALPYHARLEPELRARNQDAFLSDEGLVLVATIAFGMGIDKPDVRFVVHLDLPGSLEAYYQETGRAGRDGMPAETLLLYGLQDLVFRRNMIDQSGAPEAVKRVERTKLDALLGVCETAHCRRQAILAHFGESMNAPCGNCDTCMTEIETWDATTACRKAISAMLRTGQRFGTGHLVDVLLGVKSEKVLKFGHENLPTFGVGTELDRKGWGGVFRQMIVRGIVEVDHDSYGALRTTELAGPVLRGDQPMHFRRELTAVKSASVAKAKNDRLALTGEAAELFEALRVERTRLAREQNVPAYVIFHDATLVAMAMARPATLNALGEIPGMGRTKVERYGANVLAVVGMASAAA